METLATLRKQMESARDLQSVVKTMKAVAATSIWQYEQAVAALRSYNRTVELGLQIILRSRADALAFTQDTPPPLRLGALVFGSDQGLVGRFNDVVADFAVEQMNALQVTHEHRHIIAIGQRVETRLAAAGQPIAASHNMPTSLSGIRPLLNIIMTTVEAWWLDETVDHIWLYYNYPETGASYEPRRVQLLPVDLDWLQQLRQRPWPGNTIPAFDQNWDDLFSDLIQEYFFVATHRAFAASLAAENASRLASMQAAERNIEDRLGELAQQYHQRRQSSITSELLDIVAGAEALSDRSAA